MGFNINKTVFEYAKLNGLQGIGTGGGCDFITYMYPNLKDENEQGASFIISTECESPDSLTESCEVVFFSSGDWEDQWISFNFNRCIDAIDALACQDIRAAMMWRALQCCDDERAEEVTNLVKFTTASMLFEDNKGLTHEDLSEHILNVQGIQVSEVRPPYVQPKPLTEIEMHLNSAYKLWLLKQPNLQGVALSADDLLATHDDGENEYNLTSSQETFLRCFGMSYSEAV